MLRSKTLDSKVTPWTTKPWLVVKKQLQYNLFKNFNHPNKNTDFGLKNGFGFSFSVSSALFCMQIAQQRSLTFFTGICSDVHFEDDVHYNWIVFLHKEPNHVPSTTIHRTTCFKARLLQKNKYSCTKREKKSFYWAKNAAPRNKWALTNNLRHTKMTCMVVGSILNSAGGTGVGCRRV